MNRIPLFQRMFNFIKLFVFSTIIVLAINNKANAQCANADFSLGNFTNWVCSTGDAQESLVNGTSAEVYNSVVAGLVQGTTNSLPNTVGQQTLITNTTLTDNNTGGALKMTPPNGAPACRLGNGLVVDCGSTTEKSAARMSYTFTVTPSNSIFTYQYAVVLQDPGTATHTSTQKPKFTMYVKQGATQIGGACGIYEVTAGNGVGYTSIAGLSTDCLTDKVTYKNWTTASVDLGQWMGQSITVEFTTYDCTQGGHFGYAYISCYCGSVAITQKCSGTSDILTAPPGFLGYSWSNGGGTGESMTVPNPVNGTFYTCTCTAVTGCSVTLVDTIRANLVNVTVNSPTICENQTATLTATGTGYTYNWSNALGTSATVNVSPTTTTPYTVTASEGGGCSNTVQSIVTVNPLPTGTTSSTLATCNNSNGTIQTVQTFNAYSWNTTPVQTTQTASGLSPGPYIVTVTDNNGCVGTITGNVSSNSPVVLNTSFTPEYCSKSNGSATVTATGGSGVYTYTWSNGQTTATATGLAAGPYSVTVSDGVCPQNTSVTVTAVAPPTVAISNIIPAKCGVANGGATSLASGGTGACTYAWSNAQTTAALTNVAGGTYTVTATDSKGCTATNSVVIKSYPAVTATTSTIASTCTFPNGSITAIPAAGTGAYTYLWSNAATTVTVSNIIGGATTYNVTVTDSVGCTAKASGVVANNPGPNITGTANEETCTGLNNGSVNGVNVTGGTGTITYLWSNAATTQNITGLAGGSYTLTVTDQNGCSSSKPFVVPTHALVSATATSTPEYCSKGNGTATGVCSLGDNNPATYTYAWSNAQTTATISNIVAATYTVTVSDSHCSATTSVIVNSVAGPTVSISNAIPAKCGLANGSAIATAAGGTGIPTYLWSNAQTNATLSNVVGGTYTVTATDTKGCTATSSVVIKSFASPTVTTTPVSSTCGSPNGTITANPVGGTGVYTYSWNPTAQTTQTATGIVGGASIYTVTLTDSVGCTATATGVIPNIAGPTVTGTTSDETCLGLSNGSVNITPASGTTPYTYLWSNAATTQNITLLPGAVTYIVTITDKNGCTTSGSYTVATHPLVSASATQTPEYCNKSNGTATGVATLGDNGPYTYLWSNALTTATISNLVAGPYTVTVSDSHCSASTTITVLPVAGPTATTTVVNAKCGLANGSATVIPAGGTGVDTYLWSNALTTITIQNELAATYNVTVTDTKGCTATATAIIPGSTLPTAIISTSVDANCGFLNGSITAQATGGTPSISQGYTYIWAPSVQNTQIAAGIPAGTYSVTVTDSLGCTASTFGKVNQLPGPTASAVSISDTCSRGVGAAIVTASGGHGKPYTYLWFNGDTTKTIGNLASPGPYTVTISDGGTCYASTSVSVANMPGPHAYFIATPTILTVMDGPVTFNDLSTGTVVSWDWSLGDGSADTLTTFTHSYPEVGTFPVTLLVTDKNGCKDSISDTIKVRDIYTFYVPNCFTPTGDSLNDVFYPQGVNWDPNYFEMYIFDRWGNMMFKSLDQKKDRWNGTLNNSGTKDDVIIDVYVYLIRTKELNGPKHQYIGRVTTLK